MKTKEFLSCSWGASRYMALFCTAITRKHRFFIPDHDLTISCQHFLTQTHKNRWDELYGRELETTEVPFDYHSVVATRVLFQFLAQMGVNFRHVLYMRHQSSFANDHVSATEAGKLYHLTFSLDRVIEIRQDRVVLVIKMAAQSPTSSFPVTITKGYILVKNISSSDMESVRRSSLYTQNGSASLKGISKVPTVFEKHGSPYREAVLNYPPNAGLRYGAISGDLNLLHISKLFARLSGFPRPFAQGLYSSNYALSTLSSAVGAPVIDIDITFVNPVILNQTASLKYTNDYFEIQDADSQVLCRGNYQTAEKSIEKRVIERAI